MVELLCDISFTSCVRPPRYLFCTKSVRETLVVRVVRVAAKTIPTNCSVLENDKRGKFKTPPESLQKLLSVIVRNPSNIFHLLRKSIGHTH